jgi:hypothetical protein
MIKILYFCHSQGSEEPAQRADGKQCKVPFRQLRAGFRFAQDDKINWG